MGVEADSGTNSIWANIGTGSVAARLEPIHAEFPDGARELSDGVNRFEFVGNILDAKSEPKKECGEILYRGLVLPLERRIDSFVTQRGSVYVNKNRSEYVSVMLHRVKQLYDSGLLSFGE